MKLTTIIEQDSETGLYIGIIPGIPGAHSQGETREELRANMKEVREQCFEQRPAFSLLTNFKKYRMGTLTDDEKFRIFAP